MLKSEPEINPCFVRRQGELRPNVLDRVLRSRLHKSSVRARGDWNPRRWAWRAHSIVGVYFCCYTKGRDHGSRFPDSRDLTSWLLLAEVPTIDLDVTTF